MQRVQSSSRMKSISIAAAVVVLAIAFAAYSSTRTTYALTFVNVTDAARAELNKPNGAACRQFAPQLSGLRYAARPLQFSKNDFALVSALPEHAHIAPRFDCVYLYEWSGNTPDSRPDWSPGLTFVFEKTGIMHDIIHRIALPLMSRGKRNSMQLTAIDDHKPIDTTQVPTSIDMSEFHHPELVPKKETLLEFMALAATREKERRASGTESNNENHKDAVVMINLLKYTHSEIFPDAQSVYQNGYGRGIFPILASLGARLFSLPPVASAHSQENIEIEPFWESVAIVRYPSPSEFVKMSRSEQYHAFHHYRELSLQETALIPTVPECFFDC